MSRSAADATRFTATSPHAYSKPTASRSAPSNTSSPSSAPRTQPTRSGPLAGRKGSPRIGSIPLDGSETPQEKVARLRAAHEAAKQAQISSWDTVVVRGRVWADRAHRFAAVGLISLTGLAGLVTVYALFDMGLHNRRKQKIYYAEQRTLLQEKLAVAREAASRGEADEDQMLLINRERAAEEAEQAAKQRKGMWGSTKEWLLGGMKKDEEDSAEVVNEGGTLSVSGEGGLLKMHEGSEGEEVGSGGMIGTSRMGAQENHSGGGRILEAVEDKRRGSERESERSGVKGGMLDRMAQEAVDAGVAEAGKAKGGWTSWLTSK